MSDSIVRLPYRSVSVPGGSTGYNAIDIPYTQIYKTNNTPESTALTTNVPIKAVITTTRDINNTSTHWTMPSSNCITYTGASHKAVIDFDVAADADAGGGQYRLRVYKNGAALNSVIFPQNLHTSTGRPLSYCLTVLTDVVSADYFEIWTEEVITGASMMVTSAVFSASFAGWL